MNFNYNCVFGADAKVKRVLGQEGGHVDRLPIYISIESPPLALAKLKLPC